MTSLATSAGATRLELPTPRAERPLRILSLLTPFRDEPSSSELCQS